MLGIEPGRDGNRSKMNRAGSEIDFEDGITPRCDSLRLGSRKDSEAQGSERTKGIVFADRQR
eukprot:1167488-Rhodomonas_salina.1